MARLRVRWTGTLVLAGAMLVAGCSGGNGDSAVDQGDAGRTAAEAEPSPVLAVPEVITSAALVERLEGPDAPLILDVRSSEEYEAGHIPGAINIPYDRIAASLDSLQSFRGDEIVVYCRTGRRAGLAEKVLREAGFTRVVDLEGHMTTWNAAELPVAVPMAECC